MRGQSRVFGFGIGSSVNRYLIEGVARAGRGAAEVVRQGEPADEAVARLYKRLDGRCSPTWRCASPAST